MVVAMLCMLRTTERCFIFLQMYLIYLIKRFLKMSYYDVGPCASNPCINGGTCSVIGRRKIEKYQCKCKLGYYGKICEKKGKYVYLTFSCIIIIIIIIT